jgi:hypothetical protein
VQLADAAVRGWITRNASAEHNTWQAH